jgi:hypothetical protein
MQNDGQSYQEAVPLELFTSTIPRRGRGNVRQRMWSLKIDEGKPSKLVDEEGRKLTGPNSA